MIPWQIKTARALPGYRLEVSFADGLRGVVDVSDVPHAGVFAPWSDAGYFELVRVDERTGTVCWPGGEDLAPDRLYEDLKRQQATAM